MKTKVELSNPWRKKTFIAKGSPSDVSDRIVRIKRAFGFKVSHGVQAVAGGSPEPWQAPSFIMKPRPDLEAQHAAFLEQQRAEITKGKIAVRWSQARCGYILYSGRSPVLGLETFISESSAWEWLEETHNIKKP